jgi:esterase/lipase superfamily enzyme
MRKISVIVVATVVVSLAGCQTTLMPTPAIVSDGHIDPFKLVVPEYQNSEAPVFVASARTVSGKTDPARFYTTDRSRMVRVGIATLEIGPRMTWDELVHESLVAKRKRKPEILLTAYEEYGPLWSTAWPPDIRFDRDWDAAGVDRGPGDRFVEAIEEQLALSRHKQITIYVHGFNTKFDDNLKRASEFWHYMARDEVVMSFDWASKGSVFSYEVDKANANFAIRQFRVLLEFLAANTSAERINIMAHSAGNPIAIETLRQLSLMYYHLDDEEVHRRTKIGRVVLAAPDMDLDTALSAGVDGAGRITQGFIIYASRKDKALGFSGDIFGNIRLGRSIGKLTDDERDALIRNDTQWIDVTNAQKHKSTWLGHSYFHDNPWVSSDLMIFIRFGATAEERGLVRDMETGFLTFPDDYEERLPEIVRQLEAKYLSAAPK